MDILNKILVTLICLSYVSTGLVVVFLQFLAAVFVNPFSSSGYQKINYYLTFLFNKHLIFVIEHWSNSQLVLQTNEETHQFLGKEKALIIGNHGIETEWMFGVNLADKFGVLGNTKGFAKQIMKFAPIWGWSIYFQEYIFLNRDWNKDKGKLKPQLDRLASYKDPLWLTLFPEGTRFTPEKHEVSVAYAKKAGLPILNNLLLPRTKGFVETVKCLKASGRFGAVYNFLVALDPECDINESGVAALLLRRKSTKLHFLVERFPLKDIPDDETEAANWLFRLFQNNDKILEDWKKTGKFPRSKASIIKPFAPDRFALVNMILWGLATLYFVISRVLLVLKSGSVLGLTMLTFFIIGGYIGVNLLLKLSNTRSTYGKGKSE